MRDRTPRFPLPARPWTSGTRVVIDACPLEGGATVHVNGVEVVPRVETETCGPITFEMPEVSPGVAVVTFSSSTPEELFAAAFVYTVS